MFCDCELDQIRADLTDNLPERVTIQRETRTADGAGGATTSWTTIANVAALVTPATTQSSEPTIADRPASSLGWIIRMPALTDVLVRDRIMWGTRRFDVVAVRARRSLEMSTIADTVEVS